MEQSASLSHSVMLLSFAGSLLLLTNQWWPVASSSAMEERDNGVIVGDVPSSTQDVTSASSIQVPAVRSGFVVNHSRLVVDLSDRKVYVRRLGQPQQSFPIAVGQAGWETPTGTFNVVQMQQYPTWRHPITKELIPPGSDNPLGSRWIGFWVDGEHQIGFHGTNQPDRIGQAVSHGCIRMHNQDIEHLYDQVTINTPVIVQP